MTPLQRVEARLVAGVTVLTPKSNLGHDTTLADELYDSVRRTLELGCSRILIDFSYVQSIDATGIARLTRALTSICRVGGELKLLSVPPKVRDLLEIIRLRDAFELHENEAEAIGSFADVEVREGDGEFGLPVPESDVLVSVGWLTSDQDYARGTVAETFYRRLEDLLRDPWQPFASPGSHECALCQFDGPRGGASLFVPHQNRIYVAPELILHYINCHHFQPPREFIDAVIECPDPQSREYKKKLLENGGRELLESVGEPVS